MSMDRLFDIIPTERQSRTDSVTRILAGILSSGSVGELLVELLNSGSADSDRMNDLMRSLALAASVAADHVGSEVGEHMDSFIGEIEDEQRMADKGKAVSMEEIRERLARNKGRNSEGKS